MRLLYGTGNEGKINSMRECLAPLSIELIGLSDMNCLLPQVDEIGRTPIENARIKAAAYYKATGIPIFSCDSGLYIEQVPEELQPGIHVRNIGGKYLTDEEMIQYYSALAKRFGGNLTAQYKNAICLVMSETECYEYTGEDICGEKFIITDKPHEKRTKGFPINSLSVHIESGRYYNDIAVRKNSSINEGFRNFFTRVFPHLLQS